MTNGPALPSESITVDVVDRRPSPSLVVGMVPDDKEVPSSFEEITQIEHAELVKSFNDWRNAYEQQQMELNAAQKRKKRNFLLADTDWVVIYHKEKGTAIPDGWESYRQALRDVPQQDGFPQEVVWPTKP